MTEDKNPYPAGLMALAFIWGVVAVVALLAAIWSSPFYSWAKLASTAVTAGLVATVLVCVSIGLDRPPDDDDSFMYEARGEGQAPDSDLDWRP